MPHPFRIADEFFGVMEWTPSDELRGMIQEGLNSDTEEALHGAYDELARLFLENMSAVALAKNGDLCVDFLDAFKAALKGCSNLVRLVFKYSSLQ